MFEVVGTHFERGVFEIYLEKKAPKPLSWILNLGPLPGRIIGLLLLAFSFLFSTSRAPMTFIMERGLSPNPEAAMKIQQDIGYVFFFIAVVFYLTIFFFRNEKMVLIFNKGSKLFSVVKESCFRFSSAQRGNVPFHELKKVEKEAASKEAPQGKVIVKSNKMPEKLQRIEFAVLTAEQFEYFPLNIERMMD